MPTNPAWPSLYNLIRTPQKHTSMKRLPILAALFAASFAIASCGNDTADGDETANDTAILTSDPMATDGTMNSTDGTMNSGDGMNTGGSSAGTTNADGSVTYPDGVVRGTDGSYRRADGTTMSADEVKSYQSVQGKTITTDGTVRDRDGDGRVGTAEVKEEYKQGRDAVKGTANDVKQDIKD